MHHPLELRALQGEVWISWDESIRVWIDDNLTRPSDAVEEKETVIRLTQCATFFRNHDYAQAAVDRTTPGNSFPASTRTR